MSVCTGWRQPCASPHLPGFVESAHCAVAQTEHHGKEGIEVLLLLQPATERRSLMLGEWFVLFVFKQCFQLLHCSDLDELLQQRGAFHQACAQAQVGHHPVLHLVKAPHKPLQVGRDGAWELVTAEHVVDELHLRDKHVQPQLVSA